MVAMLTYIYVGIALFLFGWCAWYVSIPCALALSYVVVNMIRDCKSCAQVTIRPSTIIGIIVIGVISYAIGWGRFTEQAADYAKHNAIMNDLVSQEWPVVYEGSNGESALLTYYLGQYLFPCLVGKIFASYRIAEILNAIWSYWGITLVYINLTRILKSKSAFHDFIILFLILFFSCPTEIGSATLSLFVKEVPYHNTQWFCYDSHIKLQYSSSIVALRWVYPQVIVNWMILTIFIENHKKTQYYIPLLLPALFYGSLSFLGLIPYAIVGAVSQFVSSKDKVSVMKSLLSPYNILTSVTLGLVIIVYLLGNVASQKPVELSFRLTDYSGRWAIYIVFVTVMVMIYMLLLAKESWKNWMFYTTMFSLSLYPLFTMGYHNDFTMRCSIPALFVMMVMTTKLLMNFKKVILRATIMSVLILLSSARFCYHTLDALKSDDITQLADNYSYGTMGRFIYRDDPTIDKSLKYNYFTYDLSESPFYKYFAR